MKYCPQCRAEYREGFDVCYECKEPLVDELPAEEINPNLIIIGREQKKKGILGLPIKHLKRKLAEKCKYSLLFVN